MELDEVFRYLGIFGRYHTSFLIFVSVVGNCFPAWQMMSMVFTSERPVDYTCANGDRVANDNLTSYYVSNDSTETIGAFETLLVGNETADRCFFKQTINGTTEEVACTDWDYTVTFGERTIVTDFDLVCSKDMLSETAQSIFMFGVLVGALVGGTFSDIFGRKIILVVSCLLEGVFGICLVFTGAYTSFVLVWFFVGMFEQSLNLAQYILIIEMFTPEKRILALCVNAVMWGFGFLLVTLFAYLLPDWRHLQLLIGVANLIAVPFIWWLVCESVRWQMLKGRLHSAEKTLHRIAKINNIDAPDVFLTSDDTELSDTPDVKVDGATEHEVIATGRPDVNFSGRAELRKDEGFRIKHLLKAPYLIRNAFIMFCSWLASSMIYYGMSLNSSNLAGNKYINFLLLGLVETVGYFLLYFMIEWWGRRPSLILSHCIVGVCSIISSCIPPIAADGTDLSGVILAFALVGRFGVTISFALDFFYGAEIFPTVIRNAGVGWCSFWARIGGVVAPFVVSLNDVSTYIPLNVFGVISLIAAALVVYLPETRQIALPETLLDGEILARSARPPEWPACLTFSKRTNDHKYRPTTTTQM